MAIQALLIKGLQTGLKYTENDISHICDIFQKLKIPSTTISEKNAQIVRERLEQFCTESRSNDSLILYYTGHGLLKSQKLYFIFSNSGSIYQNQLSLASIVEALASSCYTKIILLLDCCNAEAALTVLQHEDIERFHLVYSSRTIEKSWELDEFKLSAFTKFLCDSIDDALQNPQKGKPTTLADLDTAIRQKVKSYNEEFDTEIPLPGHSGSKADQIVLFTSYSDADAVIRKKIQDYYTDFRLCIEKCSKMCSKGYAWCKTVSMNDIEFHKYAIPTVNTSNGTQMKLNDFFREWVISKENYLALLGNVGVGKTSACFYLVSLVTEEQSTFAFVPIFIPLHEWDEISKETTLLTSINHFSNSFFTEQEIQQMINAKQLLLLLDGFDEISAESTLSSILSNFQKIVPFLRLGCKTLLTCRTHYFADESQIDDVLQRKTSGTDFATLLLSDSPYRFEVVDLQEFTEDEIIEAIHLSVSSEDANQIWDEIKSIYDLRDLAKRAIILKMIINTLPELRESSKYQEVTTTTLYYVYTRKLLLRELKGRDYKMDLGDMEKFIEYIASLMWRNQTLSINTEKFKEEIAYFFHQKEYQAIASLDQYIYSGRVSSFFIRNRNDNYLFSHKSFFEYYLARYCVNSIERNAQDECWSKKWFDKEIATFIADIIKKENKKHIIFYLFDTANRTTNPIIIWNVLHILSLLDNKDVGAFLTNDIKGQLLEKAAKETNCVIIRQYCRVIAKFIDRSLAEEYIEKIIDIVKKEPMQNHENNETYFNYYGGKDAACQAFIKHLQVAEPKYDANLHIYLLGNVANSGYVSQFKSAVGVWAPGVYDSKRVIIEEAITLMTIRSESVVAQ